MTNIIKRIYKWFCNQKMIRDKYFALYHLEADLGFLEETNDKVFTMTEEEMRKKKAELEFKTSNKTISDKEKAELVEIEGNINKYTEIKGVQVNTRAELLLVKKYIEFLESPRKWSKDITKSEVAQEVKKELDELE